MARHAMDKSSKWLIQHHGDAILRLAGAADVVRWKALQPELVQPRQLPDGLLEVHFRGERQPDYFLLEIATYPEKRLLEQVMDDFMLAYQHLRQVPELLTLVLAPKGRLRIAGHHELHSRRQWAGISVHWKVVELWTLSAEELLRNPDVGVIPWVPLTRFDGPAAELLRRCRERLEQQALPNEKESMLVVSQVLASLRYTETELLAFLGGDRNMSEFPLIQKFITQTQHKSILQALEVRFGEVPHDISTRLGRIRQEKRLEELHRCAVICPNLEAFRKKLRGEA